MSEPGVLYLVPTPIGDVADLSPRARQVLVSVDQVAAEDTRTTLALYREAGLEPVPRLVSYHDHNERQRAPALVQRLLGGDAIALVSDAGTPLVSDPGYRLVVAAAEAGVRVVPLPGPSAAIAALSASALPPDRFLFLGFLPREAGKRAKVLEERRFEPATVIVYEAPHRILETLAAMQDVWGDRPACLARSLTKVWEELLRGSLSEIAARLAAEERVLGELTLVVGGYDGDPAAAHEARIARLVDALTEAGVPVGAIRDALAATFDLPRREAYQRALAARR